MLFFGFTAAGGVHESVELINIYETTPEFLQTTSSGLPASVAVSVGVDKLNEISGSVLAAESWLRSHVLSDYPATKITTIVAGAGLNVPSCHGQNLALILSSLKNIYHSLTRWGLEREIKVSPAFTPLCTLFTQDNLNATFSNFLRSVNSTYSIILSSACSPSHLESIKKLGFEKVNVLINTPKFIGRKLSHITTTAESKVINPYPARPTPLPQISPLHSSLGFSVPANVAKGPQPPLSHSSSSASPVSFPSDSPPPASFSVPPATLPATPPFSGMPPCNPVDDTARAPAPGGIGVVQKLWCVAKPSVPGETLQEAVDYACGEGGAECEEISPSGNCYNPDNVVAHASYAFNSYWQKTKRNGGTCNFGGTAMLISSDPSKYSVFSSLI